GADVGFGDLSWRDSAQRGDYVGFEHAAVLVERPWRERLASLHAVARGCGFEIADGQVGEGLSNEPCLLRLGGGGTLHNDGVDPYTRLSPDLEGARASIGQGDLVGWPEREAPRGAVDAVPHAVRPRLGGDPQDKTGDLLVPVVASGPAFTGGERQNALGGQR